MPDPGPDPVTAKGDGRESLELSAFAEFARLAAAGEGVALVTVVGAVGSVPRGMGAALAVREDGSIVGTVGGGRLEHEAIKLALEAIADGCPRRVAYDFTAGPGRNLDMACAGKAELYVQPAGGGPKLLIFGAGHIARALAPMARIAGFAVTVLDNRPDLPEVSSFPAGVRLVNGDYSERAAALEFSAERTYVVIVTHGHANDAEVLAACLPRPRRYLGMIGSRAKVGQVFAEVGGDEKALAAVRAPIGLSLGGRSPGEIAVSILAELQAVRNDKQSIVPMSGGENAGRGDLTRGEES